MVALPNHDLVLTKAFDHEARGFWLTTDVPPLRLILPKFQVLVSLPFPGIGNSPPPIPELLQVSPFQGRLCALKLVLELAEVTGELKLARVAPDARCESASLVDVGEGGARA